MIPAGSLPFSQGADTYHSPEPDESSPQLPTLFPWNPLHYLPIYAYIFQVFISSFRIFTFSLTDWKEGTV
jgi:hypothetical protein